MKQSMNTLRTHIGRFEKPAKVLAVVTLGAAALTGCKETVLPELEPAACTYTIPAGEYADDFAEKYLGAESPYEKQDVMRPIGRQSGINNINNIVAGREYKLTKEQCALVDQGDGEVSYIEQQD